MTIQFTPDDRARSARTSAEVVLPTVDGGTVRHLMHEPVDYPRHPAPFTSRTVLAAAHVVADVHADTGC
jgi:hypothetical protein